MASKRARANRKSTETDPDKQAKGMRLPAGVSIRNNPHAERIKLLEAQIEQMKEDSRKAAEENDKTTKELLESNKELLAFSYIASHDLQEPLRKIHTFTKMICNDPVTSLSGESATFLDRIMVSVRRMRLLTDDLLNYAQVNNSNDDEPENTNLNSLLNEVLEDIKDTITSQDAEIRVSELPVVKVIPLLMRQLFVNLIGNALKYRKPEGHLIVNISSSLAESREIEDLAADPQTRYCKIKITDNGIGFPQEQAQRIFEAFRRLHGKDKYEGTGIGLAICKKIAVRHNGFITAVSSPDNGATFNLFLPL